MKQPCGNTNHERAFQKKAASIAKSQFEIAIQYPLHCSIIMESITDQELAIEITDRLGIPKADYESICKNVLAMNQKLVVKEAERFHYWEIGEEQGGETTPSMNSKLVQYKTKATIKKPTQVFNVLEEVVQWQKFDQIQ